MAFKDNFYRLFSQIWSFEKKQKLIIIDFEKPWWHMIKPFITQYLFIVFSSFIEIAFLTLLPIVFVKIIQSQDYHLLGFVTISGVVIFAFRIWALQINTTCLQQLNRSVFYSVDKFFLTVDPSKQVTKSSGQIISKVDRSAAAIIDIISILTFDIYPVFFALIVVVITFFRYNFQLGLITTGILAAIIAVNTFARIFGNRVYQDRIIQADDEAKSDSVEALEQAPYTRYIFAIKQDIKIQASLKKAMTTTSNYLQFATIIDIFTYIIYLISISLISGLTINLVKQNSLDTITAIGLVTTYIAGTTNIVIVSTRIRRLLESEYRLQDLFDFIREF